MGIYIHGMRMPKAGDCIIVYPDGEVWNGGKRIGKVGTAIELPPHGRLGDLDALGKVISEGLAPSVKAGGFKHPFDIIRAVANAPTIIPADHSVDTGKMINDDPEYEESLDSRVMQALEHGFYATMYGEVYKPDRPIIFIKSDEAFWDPKLGGICFIWGYPGPDISIYRPGQYGITWALMEHELKGYCAADPKKEDT